ncbi:DMT family transporter [Euzebya pacifica]|uniref:DMT family transporter n=1 Tax=Euzebya pacifica TaxID=1608957 RepID=UPI0030F65E53
MTALLLSLGSAVTFGAADFLGGLATRRGEAVPVAAVSQAVGLVLVAAAMLVLPGSLSTPAMIWGGVAGLAGAGGLVAYFRALGMGQMGAAAPMASLVGAAVPVTFGLGLGERPDQLAVVGIAVGIAGTVLVSRTGGPLTPETAAQRRGLLVAAFAGALFGVFFVALDQAPDDSGLWPLVAARIVGLVLLGAVIAARRPAWPRGRVAGMATTSGLLDMTANVLFLLATRQGLLVLTSVVTGLYPVGVVLLAWLVLRERLGRSQQAGVALALGATVLIAV